MNIDPKIYWAAFACGIATGFFAAIAIATFCGIFTR